LLQGIDGVEYTVMPKARLNRRDTMATTPLKHKTAMDKILESMDELAVSARKKMTTEEMR
jgi:hypothetical protein